MLTDFSDANEYVKLFYKEIERDDGVPEKVGTAFMTDKMLGLLGAKELLKVIEGVYITKKPYLTIDSPEDIELGIVANAEDMISTYAGIHSQIFSMTLKSLKIKEDPKMDYAGITIYEVLDMKGEKRVFAFLPSDRSNIITFTARMGNKAQKYMMPAFREKYGIDRMIAENFSNEEGLKLIDCYKGEYVKC